MNQALLSSIQTLLAEPIAAAELRERCAFAAMQAGTDGRVVLFGAGRLGHLCARALHAAGVPLLAFCDGNPALHGTIQEGVEVLSPPDAARRFGDSALFVVAIWTGTARESMVDRIAHLRDLGCRYVTTYAPLIWAHGRGETPFHSFDLPSHMLAHAGELHRLAGLLADEVSLATLLDTLRQRLHGGFNARPSAPDQYFPADIVTLASDEVVVDGGAFDGDTLLDFLQRSGAQFCAYHAFEPDPANAGRLGQRIRAMPASVRERISVHPVALHSCETELSFDGHGGQTSRLVTGGTLRVQGKALDQILAGRRVTFLKLDVEGAESEALKGAERILTEQRPIVAACVYHGPDDLWKIPLQLHASMPKSRLFLRQHGFDGWETVCYAVPPGR